MLCKDRANFLLKEGELFGGRLLCLQARQSHQGREKIEAGENLPGRGFHDPPFAFNKAFHIVSIRTVLRILPYCLPSFYSVFIEVSCILGPRCIPIGFPSMERQLLVFSRASREYNASGFTPPIGVRFQSRAHWY
jgi:hypothetical protein